MSKVHNKAGNAGKSGRARLEQLPTEHISALTPSTFQITSEEIKIKTKALLGKKGRTGLHIPTGQRSPGTPTLEELVLHCSTGLNPNASEQE